MKIIRKLDLLSMLFPMVVRAEKRKLASVTSFEGVKDIPLDAPTTVELKLDLFFSTKVVAKETSILLVEQPYIVRMLSLLMIVSLCMMKVVWGRNEMIDYALLVFPVLYLLAIVFYLVFRRNQFLQVTELAAD